MSVNGKDVIVINKLSLKDWNASEQMISDEAATRIKAAPYDFSIETHPDPNNRSAINLNIGRAGVDGSMNISVEIDEGMPRVHFYTDDGDPLCSVRLSPEGAKMECYDGDRSVQIKQPSFDLASWKANEAELLNAAEAEIAQESITTSPAKPSLPKL